MKKNARLESQRQCMDRNVMLRGMKAKIAVLRRVVKVESN